MGSKKQKQFAKGNDVLELDDDNGLSQSIEDMMRSESANSQESVKELLGEDKVKARTDLSARQVKLVTKAYFLAKLTNDKYILEILKNFLTLSISKDRKSRTEYVEGLKAKIDQTIQGMGNLRGQFGK